MGNTLEDRVLPPFKKAANENVSKQPADQPAHAEGEFFGLAHQQSNPAGFKIMFAAGHLAAVYYHDIISPLTFDGSGLIEINTPSITVKIMGKNLALLFDHFFEGRIAWIKEPDASFTQAGENQPEIESIKIETKA